MLRAKLFSEASGQVVLKLHGVSPQKIKKTKHRNLYNDRLMLKNNNQKHDFLNQFCQFFVMFCTSINGHFRTVHVQRIYVHQRAHKTTRKTKHGNLYDDLANVQKSFLVISLDNPVLVFLVEISVPASLKSSKLFVHGHF